MYKDIDGLSCIENHILSIMRQRNDNINWTYFDCAVPLKVLYESLVIEGTAQENFDVIARIQDVLKGLNAISFIKTKTNSIELMLNKVEECSENEYILIRVSPQFTRNVLGARGLRPDHYVLIEKIENKISIINDIPEKTITITQSELSDIYKGDFFKVIFLRTLSIDDSKHLWESRYYIPRKCDSFYINQKILSQIKDFGLRLRNMTGVCKILRRRMKKYYNNYIDTDFMDEHIKSLDKKYALFEFYNLKNEDIEKYSKLLHELIVSDIYYMNELSYRLEINFV